MTTEKAKGDRPKPRAPQISYGGRMAWVVDHLVRVRGTDQGEVTRWVIDRWIDSDGRAYLKENGVELNDFPPPDGVVPIHRRRKSE